MRKKINTVLLLIALICAVFSLLEIMCFFLQPKPFLLGTQKDIPVEPYMDPEKVYYLSGDMECYPRVIIAPQNFGTYSEHMRIIHNLGEVRADDCINGENYMATVRFFINAPSSLSHALYFPGEFCEYMLTVNRTGISYTSTFRSETPAYPSPRLVVLPHTDNGEYEIILYIITPVNSLSNSTGYILFGEADRIAASATHRMSLSIICSSIVLITLFFCLIQYIAVRRDRVLTSFIMLCFAVMLRLLMTDTVAIMQFFPKLQYQLGSIIMSLTMPILLLTMLYHAYCLFPSVMPKNVLFLIGSLQIVPLLNSLSLFIFPVLQYATYLVQILAYFALFYYCYKVVLNKYPYSRLFAIGIILFWAYGMLEFATRSMIVRAPLTQFYPIVAFIVLELFLLAKKYTDQREAEQYYTDELNRTLEAMQASESAFLNAQMKPHFLYNTLNTIADLCVSDPPKAISLIGSLEDYCRLILSIDNVDKTVPLSREMELVSAYTSIEKERFPSINFYTDFRIRMPRVELPPLTLQPLIENAIKHGVRKSDKPGAVTLRIRESYDQVTFYVSDNGCGMDEETMSKLFNEPKENKSIGVYNIDKRLKNLYHTGLDVDSTIGLGTCVSFSVPK